MKSDAWIESDHNSTWALRDPTLNELDLQELSKSFTSPVRLLWSCKGPDVRAVGSPMSFQSIRKAKSCLVSSSEVPRIKMAYRNWKGLWKDWKELSVEERVWKELLLEAKLLDLKLVYLDHDFSLFASKAFQAEFSALEIRRSSSWVSAKSSITNAGTVAQRHSDRSAILINLWRSTKWPYQTSSCQWQKLRNRIWLPRNR